MTQTKCSKSFRYLAALAFTLGLAVRSQAQISVTAAGAPADAFGTIPPATSWSTKSLPGGAGAPEGTLGTDANGQMDAFVNGSTNAFSTITAAVGNNANNPPGTSATAQWSSAGFYLQTRPTGNAVTLLMATLRNDSGGNVVSFNLRYDYIQGLASVAAEVIPGLRVYYNLTGAAGSWVPLGNFGDATPANSVQPKDIPVDLAANPWPSGTLMYILFADDNSNPNNDYANQIDNFSIANVVGGVTTCVAITNQTSSITVPERGAATFSIMTTGTPAFVQWYRNNNLIPGANNATYTIPSVVYPGDNGAQFRAIVTNSICSATSTVKTLTVTPDTTAPVAFRVIGDIDPTKVHLTFSEPLDAATVNESAFEVFVTGGNPDGSYITFGASLTNGTNVTITTDPRQSGLSYSVQILDVRDASSGNNVINPNPTQVAIIATVQLIGFDTDNEWKYDINNGDRYGSGWEQAGYDDSTWASGPAGLGLDASVNGVPIRTTIAYSGNGVVTYYRKHFNFPGKTNGVVLNLRDVVEDGAIYYLNGQEVFRNRMPAGAITFATLASGATDPTPIAGPFSLAITNLQPGDNVLAVAVHQSSATSTDVELAVELTATIQEYLSGAPKVTGQPSSQTVPEGGNVTFSASVEGGLPLAYTWKKNGVAIPGATASSYTITGVVPGDAGSYSLSVTNSSGGTNSTAATLTVGADTTPPIIVSAIGSTNLNVVVVTLRDPAPGRGLNTNTLVALNNYQIALTAGGGSLAVTSAVVTTVTSNTVVTLTTATPRLPGVDYRLTLNNIVDNSVAANPVTPNTAAIAATVVLFPYTQIWRYDQSGLDLGTTWRDVGYNDTAWSSGVGVFGFETTSNTLVYLRSIAAPDGTNTILSLTNQTGAGIGGTNVTFYFRTTVNIPFNPAGATFTARAYVDDGAIFYVNGAESLRFNYNTNVTYTNFAAGALTEPTPNPSTTVMASNLSGFVTGNNVIAVEVHQDSIASSDVDFGMQLEALVTSYNVVTGPTLRVGRSGGNVTINWTGGGTLQQTTNLLNGVGATQWSDVPGNPAGTYNVTPNGQRLFFRTRP